MWRTPNLVDDFRPRFGQGHLLITTQDAYAFEHTVQISPMNQEEGRNFLFARSTMSQEKAQAEQMAASEQVAATELVKQMDGLPLAIDQAAAYIRMAQCGIAHYLHLYQTRRKELLNTRGRPAFGHSASLVATISLSCEKAQAVQGAREVLEFCSFLHPDQIPEEVLRDDEHSPFNRRIDPDHFLLHEALKELLRYSLVSRHSETETISLHRLVQAVLRDLMDAQKRHNWAERVIAVLSHTLSATDSLNWLGNQRYLLHAQHCALWIEEYQIESEEAYELLRAIGHLLQEQAQYSDAEQVYQRASNILSSRGESDPFKEAERIYDDAVLCLNKGQYKQSEVLLQRALTRLGTLYEPGHPILVMAQNTLAEIYSAQGRYTEAQRLFLWALKMREMLYEKDHPLIATTCHCLAMNYMSQGAYREAEHFYQRALQIRKQAFGESHPYVAETLHGLTVLYAKQGLIKDVPDLVDQALVTREQALGKEHVMVAEDLQSQALLHIAQKQYGEAEALLQQAVTIQEQRLGAEHPDVADSFHLLGVLCFDQSRYPEAEQFLQRALKLRQKSLEPQHSNLVQSFIALGLLYKQQRRWGEADWHFHQALRIVQTRLQTESSVQDWKWHAFLLGIMSSPEEE